MDVVVLGDVTLKAVTGLVIDERRKVVLHRWPGNDGDLVQDVGLAASRIWISGVAVGKDAEAGLKTLRAALQAGKPLDFATSAAVASQIKQVLITDLRVAQPPGRVAYFEYALAVVQFVPLTGADAGGSAAAAAGAVQEQVQAAAAADVEALTETLAAPDAARQQLDDALDGSTDKLGLMKDLLKLKGLLDIGWLLKPLKQTKDLGGALIKSTAGSDKNGS